jgi:hypothetical protein
MYYLGTGVEKSLAIAAAWYLKAAEGGDATAQFVLGAMYDTGEGVPRDKRALRCFKWVA